MKAKSDLWVGGYDSKGGFLFISSSTESSPSVIRPIPKTSNGAAVDDSDSDLYYSPTNGEKGQWIFEKPVKLANEGWQPFTTKNGWTRAKIDTEGGDEWRTAEYRVLPDGRCVLKGVLESGTDNTIADLPDECTPGSADKAYFGVVSANNKIAGGQGKVALLTSSPP